MKRKKTIKFEIGGANPDTFKITIEGYYGPARMRHESAEHMEAMASRMVLALSQHTLIPITQIKTR